MNSYILSVFIKKQIFKLKYFIRYNTPDRIWQSFAQKIHKQRLDFYQEQKKSFGRKNVTKIFYVIRRRPPAWGFFSNVIFVIQGLIYSDKNNYIPVVDMENYWVGELSSNLKVNGTHNAWCYFFNQTSDTELAEVYKSKNVILSSGTSIMGSEYWLNDRKFSYVKDNSKLNELKFMIDKYIKLNSFVLKHLENTRIKLDWSNEEIFGVFMRGTGYQTYKGAQPIMPDVEFYIQELEKLLNKTKFSRLYVATEDFRLFLRLQKHFGANIIMPSLRYEQNLKLDVWEKNQDLTFDHAILMGFDKTLTYLTETILLSQCINYVCNLSNASVFSIALSDLGKTQRWVIEPNKIHKLTA